MRSDRSLKRESIVFEKKKKKMKDQMSYYIVCVAVKCARLKPVPDVKKERGLREPDYK